MVEGWYFTQQPVCDYLSLSFLWKVGKESINYTCNNIVFSLLGSFGVIWVLKMLFYNAVGLTANSFRYGKYPLSVIKGVTL